MSPRGLIVRPLPHPDPAVHAGGFPLTDAYLRQCWSPLLGEPATTLLERLPSAWRDSDVAGFDRSKLASELGLRRSGMWRAPLERSLDRLVEYGFAEWIPVVDRGVPKHDRGELAVYTRMSPLGDLDLERVPPAVRAHHEELAKPIFDRAFPSGPLDDPVPADRAMYLAQRLDRLQQPMTPRSLGGLSR